MAASRLNPEEVQFIQSLRRMLARGGHLSDELLSPTAPIAAPKGGKAPGLVVEPRKGYWTGNPEFSRTRVGLYPEVAGSETILEILNAPGPPRGRGVILQRSETLLVDPPTTPLNYAVRANIQFGIGGQVNSVKVDWANTVVNVPGSMVRVNAEWLALGSVFPYNVGSPVEVTGTLGVQIASDPIVHKGYNTLTTWPVNGGPPTFMAVPAYAIGFWYQPVPPAGAATGYWFSINTTDPLGINADQSYYLDSQIVANGYTAMNVLPPGAKTLIWTNTTLTMNQPIVWAIAL